MYSSYNSAIYGQALNAIEDNNFETIKHILSSDEPIKFEEGGPLLVSALELDRREIAIELLNHEVDITSTNDDNSFCHMIAAKRNNTECLKKILDRRELNINATDMFGWTALMYSCYYGHPEITKQLLTAGAEPNMYDNDQMSSLIWAAGRGHTDCVTMLIQLGKAKVDQVDKCGTSPLIWACRKGYIEIVNILLKAGANVDSIGMFGWSALLVAVHGNHVDTVKLLLQHKPNVNTCDVQRHTPLIAASKDGKDEIVKLLLKARAFVNLSDNYGHTALIHAARGAHQEVVDLLLKHHADIDHCGTDKKSALYWAVEKGNLNIVERLLQSKPNTELLSKDGETCLIKAVKLRRVGIIRMLLANQAKAYATDKNGDNILHIAVRMRSATMAQLILANPKNHHLLHKTNKAKLTPLMMDEENSSPVLAMLIENKLTYKLTDTAFTNSNFHLDNPSLEYLPSTATDNQSSSSSLVKKLTAVLHRHPSQTQSRVLA